MKQFRIMTLSLAVSMGLHLGVSGWLQKTPVPRLPRAPEMLASLVELAPEPQKVVPKLQPREPAAAPVQEPSSPRKNAPRPAPPDDPPTTSRPTPVKLSGVRLTNVSGSLTVGGIEHGTAREPPPQHANPAPSASSARPVKSTGIHVVSVAQLARKPQPPDLNAQLRRHYPIRLKRLGVEGQALVRARIDTDGRVADAQLLIESDSGFGQACLNTLARSRWSIPLDRNAQPVSTYVRYRCRFQVDR